MTLPDESFSEGPGAPGALFGIPVEPARARVHILPLPLEATVSFGTGTAAGPAAVLEASAQLDLFDPVLGEPWRAGIALLPVGPLLQSLCDAAHAAAAAGDTAALNQQTGQIHQLIATRARASRAAGHCVGLLGGDHSCALGLLRAVAEDGDFGVLHIDAHCDLRPAYLGHTHSHASIMHNALAELPRLRALVQVGIRDCSAAEWARTVEDPRIHATHWRAHAAALAGGAAWSALVEALLAPLPQRVYISFDVDGLDPAACPNTGTPVPGGLSFDQALFLLDALRRSGREVVGFDLCEVAGVDAAGQPAAWDANVGARLLYQLAGLCLATEGSAR